MKNINVLMIDDNENLIKQIEEYFGSHKNINITLKAQDGNIAMDYIKNHTDEFNLIIMDLLISEKDGIEILEEMKSLGINKNVIILSSYKREYSVRMTNEFAVDYYMMKPFSISNLEKRIIGVMTGEVVVDKEETSQVQMAISTLLHKLGVPSHIKGYQYIRESIYMMYSSKEMIGGITKEIYPEIADKFETTASRVERAIRHAIEVSWSRGDYDLMEEIFGHSVDYDRAKPTNSEFIATLADRLKIDKSLIKA